MTAYIVMGAIIVGLGVWLFFSIKGAISARKIIREQNQTIEQLKADRLRMKYMYEDLQKIEQSGRAKRDKNNQNSSADDIRSQLNELLNTDDGR